MSFYMLLTRSGVLGCSSHGHILVASVPGYRCYFLSGESIKAAENIDASDDVGALLEAEKLLLKGDLFAIEVWQDESFVGRLSVAPDLKVIFCGKSD